MCSAIRTRPRRRGSVDGSDVRYRALRVGHAVGVDPQTTRRSTTARSTECGADGAAEDGALADALVLDQPMRKKVMGARQRLQAVLVCSPVGRVLASARWCWCSKAATRAGKGGVIRRVTAALDAPSIGWCPLVRPPRRQYSPICGVSGGNLLRRAGGHFRSVGVRPGPGRAGRGLLAPKLTGCGPTRRSTIPVG